MRKRLKLSKPPGLKVLRERYRTRPKKGKLDVSEVSHVALSGVLPFVLVLLINSDLIPIAVMLVFLSKWRMVAMRFNHLPANIRANLTDLIVKISTLAFMIMADNLTAQIILAAWYTTWLLLIKPQTSRPWVVAQAMISQLLGITALMWASDAMSELVVLAGVWLVVYATSYHYLSDYDEPLSRVLAKVWAVFGVQLAWIFLHWNLRYFGVVPQYALLQGAYSYIAADLYSLRQDGALTAAKVRTYLMVAIIVTLVIIISGDWDGRIL